MLRSLEPFPISTAPGFEGFAEAILDAGGSEEIAWTPAGGEPVALRAIVRMGARSLTSYSGTTWHAARMVLVSAADVQGILPDDAVSLRGESYRVCQGGIHPDGVAMVRIDLKEAL